MNRTLNKREVCLLQMQLLMHRLASRRRFRLSFNRQFQRMKRLEVAP